MKKKSEYMARYFKTHPWAKHIGWARARATKYGWKFELNVAIGEELWERDNAHLLKRPSIDREKPELGYVKENCRFIELSENSRRAVVGRTVTPAQKKAGSINIKKWLKENPHPHCTPISAYDETGKFIKSFSSMRNASMWAKVTVSHISNAVNGKQITSGGYYWKRTEATS